MTLKRVSTVEILEGAEEFSAVGLLGSRQTGKTILSQLIFKEHAYVSLEDIELRTAATTAPRTFLNENRSAAGIIIDNFQYVPELLSYMQSEGFAQNKKGEFILCGPQNTQNVALLKNHLKESVSLHTLYPLSLHELADNYQLPTNVDTVLYNGLHPAVYANSNDTHHMYRQLITLYIDKDVREYGQVENVTTFHSFLKSCAARVGQVINITALANDSDISDHTARRWLTLLEDHNCIFLVKPYHTSFGKRLIKSPKLYFYDPGIVCSLLKISQEELPRHPMKDVLFESLIMAELQSHYIHLKKNIELYFWRDKTEREITCLIDHGNSVIALDMIPTRVMNSFSQNLAYWTKLSGKQVEGFTITAEKEPNNPQNLYWRHLYPLYKTLNIQL